MPTNAFVRTRTCIHLHSLTLAYTYIYVYYIYIYIYARGFELCSSVGEKERERGGEGREGERKRGRWRKHGGGRGTPCFDPRKRRRQSRRVLGSSPQGGRHSAALKPSVYPPPSRQPSRSRSYSSAHPIPRRLSTANLRPISLTFSSSVIRSLLLSLSHSVCLAPGISCSSFSLSPAFRRYSLSTPAFSMRLSFHSRGEGEGEKRVGNPP